MLKLIQFLDSSTPFIQACDFVLMFGCGIYCWLRTRRHRNLGLTVLTISCFVSAAILLGFFLSAAPDNHPLLPLSAPARSFFYLAARLLAPLELLLFVVGIVIIARQNDGRR
jgi:hypothetical protein